MRGRRKFVAILALAGAVFVAMAAAAIPMASAAQCTVTVTVLQGKTYVFHVTAAPGTPISAMGLRVRGVIISEHKQCVPSTTSTSSSSSTTTTTTTTTSTTSAPSTSSSSSSSSTSSTSTSTSTSPSRQGSGSSSSSTTTKTGTSSTPSPSGTSTGQQQSSHGNHHKAGKSKKHTSKKKQKKKKKKTRKKAPQPPAATLPSGKGVPSPTNPTFSLSLPGPAPIGVPNFFIDSFRIPPFLIPIYQAAGIEYQVPWQVLAGINEIETDYGRNLSVSSAGAVGWMQFLPSTWKEWGVDANGDGVADPYNPVDAIFSAARYLHAAGASSDVSNAIFAYNHAGWYVQSVLLRAKLIGGIPSDLVGALTGLVQGHFPVAAAAKYADSSVVKLAKKKVKGSNAAIAIDSNPSSKGTSIFAQKASPVIAVNDGKIVKVGASAQLGRYVELQDATGNIYTYAHLGSVSRRYPVPRPVKVSSKDIAKEFSFPAAKAAIQPPTAVASAGAQATAAATRAASSTPAITGPASAGTQSSGPSNPTAPAPSAAKVVSRAGAQAAASQGAAPTVTAPMVKERLFAHPNRPASYAAGGNLQIKNSPQQITNFRDYFSDTLHLARNQYTLKPLKKGAIVIAGTILGRVGGPSQSVSSHLYFMIQPAGKKAPYIDPKPILDGWKLLEATAVYRAAGVDPFFGPGTKNPSVGQVLLMSKQQLTTRVLSDPDLQIYACGRRDIEAGLIDRRVLAVVEFLSASGLKPDVSGLQCGHSVNGATGTDAAGATGASVDITKINDVPVLGHQGPGSVTDIAIRRLLTLQGSMRPNQIISDISYKGQPSTLALPDHRNRIQITFTPDFGTNNMLAKQLKSILAPGQWTQLINRISQIPEPVVPIAPSKYAVQTKNR